MKSFRIYNMKSFEDSTNIEVKPLTIFVGRNSCGKSSLVRFPAVLAQTVKADNDSPIKFYGKMVDYGNYEDVFHVGASDKMSFEINYLFDMNLRSYWGFSLNKGKKKAEGKDSDIRDITMRITLNKVQKKLVVDKFEIIEKGKAIYQIDRQNKNTFAFRVNYSYEGKNFCERDYSFSVRAEEQRGFIPSYDRADMLSEIFKYVSDGARIEASKLKRLISHAYDRHAEGQLTENEEKTLEIFEFYDYYSEMLFLFQHIYSSEMEAINYIGPFRENPSRIYRDLEFNSHGVGVHGENTTNELIRDFRKKDAQLIKKISEWTKRVLKFEIVVKEIANGLFQVMLKDANGVETNIIDNGYGVSQVLPIITQVVKLSTNVPRKYRGAFNFESESMLILEQPELHLHPAAQAELADLFADCVAYGDNTKKIILETHSEHLIRKIQVLVAKKNYPLTKDMVRIYYVDKDEKGNASVEEMKLLDNGKFEEDWPEGFFDKGYQLSRELAKATIED